MNISEAIEKLLEIKNEHGDMELKFWHDMEWHIVQDIRRYQFEDGNGLGHWSVELAGIE